MKRRSSGGSRVGTAGKDSPDGDVTFAMNQSATVATMDVLREFGFQPNHNPLFEESLIFQFVNFDLKADLAVNKYSQQCVLFTGFLERTARVIYAPIEFYLPTTVISCEQCAAMIAYYLDVPVATPAPWLIMGRERRDVLPWMIEGATRQAAYDASPKCFVRREWLRLALQTLSVHIASLPDEMPVVFEFREDVLSLRCDGDLIVTTATGASWPEQVTTSAGELRELPKRLMSESVCVFVGATHLGIGNRSYARIIDEPGGSPTDV
jgi:hypothetical protein